MKAVYLVALAASAVQGQTFAEFSNPQMGVTYKFAIPPKDTLPVPIYMQVTAPAKAGWAGFAIGGKMSGNPLTVVYPNPNGFQASLRSSPAHTPPTVLSDANASVSVYANGSSKNSTSWTAATVLQGISQWSGGSIKLTGANSFAWAASNSAPTSPTMYNTNIAVHSLGKAVFQLDLSKGRQTQEAWDALIKGLGEIQGGTFRQDSSKAATGTPPPV